MTEQDLEHLRRWRLILGSGEADGTDVHLGPTDSEIDRALARLYDPDGGKGAGGGSASPKGRRGGSGASAPGVARWLGDIRKYFPTPVVRVLQKDAMERLNLRRLLLEPELLESVEPDVHLVASLMALNGVIPARTRETARQVVRRVVDELMKKLETPTRQAVSGSLDRAARTFRPRAGEIDWNRTIRANLKNYQPGAGTVIPERLIGYARKQRRTMRQVVLCIDQSGSMASSIVYSSIFGAVMASLPALSTHLVLFDTAVADLTDKLNDPVDILFGAQLGGGTDINQALAYCQALIRDPQNAIVVVISDLIEGGDQSALFKRCAAMVGAGIQMVTLLALSDEGAPAYDHEHARRLAGMGIPCFACTPEQFPDMMAAAIARRDLNLWASQGGLAAIRPPE